jgi:ATP-dependent DNA helicase RecG
MWSLNPHLIWIFKEITWIERYGTGVRRVTSLFENYGCPKPVFENFQHGFRVTAYPAQVAAEAEKTAESSSELGEKLGENQRKIMEIMRKNEYVTIQELAHQLTISETAVQNNISKLKAKDLLARIGSDKGGYWKIVH